MVEYDPILENDKKSHNKKLEDFIASNMDIWDERLKELFQKLKSNDKLEMLEFQALSLSYHHMAKDEITKNLLKLTKVYSKKTKIQRERLLFYSTKFSLKTTKGEKDILIDADLSEDTRHIQMLEAYIDYLRDCRSLCDNMQWIIKNKIQIILLPDEKSKK